MEEAPVTIRFEGRRFCLPWESCRAWEVSRLCNPTTYYYTECAMKVSRFVIQNYLRPYAADAEIEGGRFDLIGPGGLVIHPVIWPAGLEPGCLVDLILRQDQALRPQERNDAALEGVRQREADVRQRERDVGQRERDVGDRERYGHDHDAREPERPVQDDPRRPPEPAPPPPRSSPPIPIPIPTPPASDDAHPPHGCGQCCDIGHIRKHRACLSFFAGQTRLRDLCKCEPTSRP